MIVNRAPFYHINLPYVEGSSKGVIDSVKVFADENKMDFLLAQKSLDPGDFNASANGPSLNLKAMHVASVAKGIDIFATAESNPTQRDKRMVSEFVDRMKAGMIDQSVARLRGCLRTVAQ